MALNFQRRARKGEEDNLARGKSGETNGTVVVVDEVGGVRGGDIACDRDACGVLAGVCKVALEIPVRIGSGVAAGTAADGARVLCAGGHGAARPLGKAMDGTVRTRAGFHIRRTDSCVGVVQLSVCGPAADR